MYARTANLFIVKTCNKEKINIIRMTRAKLKLMRRANKVALQLGR